MLNVKKLFTDPGSGLGALAVGLSILGLVVAQDPWNSDLLYIEALYRDLFINSHPLREFHFSASTFFIPDFPIYFFLRSFFSNLNLVLWVYLGIQLLILDAFLKRWFSELDQKWVSLTLLLALIWFVPDSATVFFPVHHGGQWLLGLLALFSKGPIRFADRKEPTLIECWITAVVMGLLSSCDLLFLTNVCIPYGLLIGLQRIREKETRKIISDLAWFLVLLGSFVVFYLGFRKLTGSYFGWNKPVIGDGVRARDFLVDQFGSGFRSAFAVMTLVYLAVRTKKDPLGFFLLLSVGASAFFIILTGVWADHLCNRYFYPMPLAMTYASADLIRRLSQKPWMGRWVGVFGVLLVFALGVHLYRGKRQSIFDQPYSEQVRCVDSFVRETGQHEGVGSYWAAKYLSFFSKESAKILQVNDRFEPHYWINNHEAYRDFSPTFVIVGFSNDHRIAPAAVLSRGIGAPLSKKNCGTFEIWNYGPGSKLIYEQEVLPQFKNLNEFRE